MNLRLNNFECNGFIFNSNFDSGNLAKVELIRKGGEFVIEKLNAQSNCNNNALPFISLNAAQVTQSHESSSSPTIPAPPSKQVDVEFNLWTKHDCAGTPFENTNRTWFYFSIKGGEKNQLVKFNVLNLNKQAKLFSQGMHPVIKHGNNGKWERIKDKPTFYVTEENFVLSFLHRTHDNVEDNLTYYAFTYPFTYKEQMDAIEGYEKKFGKTDDELSLIARELSAPKKDKLVIKINDKLNFKGGGNGLNTENIMGDTLDELEAAASSFEDAKQAFKILERSSEKEMFDVLTENASDEVNFNEFMKTKSSLRIRPSNSNVIDENTSESMQQITNLVNNVKIELSSSTASILESTGAINNAVRAFQLQDIRQNIDEIRDDIYFYRELLINSYEGKRVDLITITSFNGMEEKREERLKNLFPDYSKPRCHTFKDKKIIFISSRVHPGETPASFVLNGFINLLLDRKSQIAIILRKMYVFKIIPLLNPDGVFNGLYRSDTLGHNLNRVYLNPRLDTQPSIYAARKLIRFYHFGYDKPDDYDETGELINGAGDGKPDIIMPSPCNDSDDDENFEQQQQQQQEQKVEIPEIETIEQNCEFDQLNVEPKTIEDTEMSTENSNETPEESTNSSESVKPSSSSDQKPLQRKREKLEKSSSKSDSEKFSTGRPKVSKSGNILNKEKKLSSSKSSEAMKSRQNTLNNSLNAHGNRSHHHHHYKHQISHYNADKQQKMIQQQYFSQQPHQGLNISLDFLMQTDEKGEKCIAEEKSNLFLYLDLHGHASKKGVFMYGNHLPNTHEAVECMLLPRLMSMNCHHFHFDACNFSERNMYLRGKRDGLSKEGSGRVAIYKTTGLIKSYTLESNYNMAKCVNVLPPKGKEQSCKVLNLIPPKFCPAIFEEVGRALGASVLDLTNSNPVSRLMNSEFRTLQGLRNALRNEISRGLSKARVNKFTKAKSKRSSVTLTSSVSQDVSKENKVYHNHHPNQLSSSSASSSSHPNANSLMQQEKQKLKMSSLNNKQSENNNKTTTIPSNQQSTAQSKLFKMKQSKVIQNFSKKDVVSVSSTSKKKKILCETSVVATTTTTTTTTNVVQSGLKLVKDHHQVPRKKIKVAAQTTSAGSPKGDTAKLATDVVDPTHLSNFFLNSELDFVGSTSTDLYGDDSLPCCSKSTSFYQQKSPSSLSNSSCSNSSQSQLNSLTTSQSAMQLKITNFLPVKKHQKLRKIKFGKDGGKSCNKIGLKKSKLKSKLNNVTNTVSDAVDSNLTSEILLQDSSSLIDMSPSTSNMAMTMTSTGMVNASKLLKKKKRTLKTENTSLKRKKSRSKPLLH